ncbi:MAG: pyridoxamine 5'-phosphate oxidase family protein [Saprospiraceae bacterium]|nr:pyridoxamine 5'-phosphate oxidase family protein [Saprospiraceae bacterium]
MKSRFNLKQKEIEEIINKCDVCTLSMIDKNNMPYALPFNFAYEDGIIYLHSAPEGKKIGILENNNNVCISFSSDYQMYIQSEKLACSYSMKYRSVLAFGKVEFCDHDDLEMKQKVLDLFMQKYAPGSEGYKYNPPALKNVKMFKVVPEKVEGKAYGY